jgi:apolipoprotein N-acyltransferase
VPLRRVLFFVNRMVDGAIAEFRAGSRYAPLPTAAGPAATFVCYEAVFPDLVRRLARGAGFLVNLTNDAWFGRSAAPEQHLAMAAVRAVENHRYLVRAANTGISAFVDPFGRIVARAPVERSTVLVETIGTRRGLTPYARSGDVLAAGCAILTLLQAVALRTLFRRTEA